MKHQTPDGQIAGNYNELVYYSPSSLLQHTEMPSHLNLYNLSFINNHAKTAYAHCQPMRKQEDFYYEFTAEIMDTAGKWSKGISMSTSASILLWTDS